MSDPIELTLVELDELERLAKAATPGPWSYYRDSCAQCEKDGTAEYDIPEIEPGWHARFGDEANAAFIASANPAAILALLSLARAGLEAGKAEESMRERAAELAESEAALRKANGIAAEAGDTRWGLDTEAASLAQYHKSVTASLLAGAIRALPLTGGDKS